MILLDTDIITLRLLGHARLAERVLGTTELVAITVVTRVELLRGRFDSLLKASDGVQLQQAQWRLDQTERELAKLVVVPIGAEPAAAFDRLRQIRKIEEGRPGRLADRRHRPRSSSHARHTQRQGLSANPGVDPGELGRLTPGHDPPMDMEALKRLVVEGESERLELKKTTGQLRSAMTTLCALLNGSGGQ